MPHTYFSSCVVIIKIPRGKDGLLSRSREETEKCKGRKINSFKFTGNLWKTANHDSGKEWKQIIST